MAITSAGYAGTVNDLQWAQMARYFGMAYAVKSAADLACTQNGANKNFNIAAGEFWGRGIMDASDAVVNIAPAVPAAGQWFLIVARRIWATGITSFVAVASSTTTTTTPTAPPTAYPTLNTNPGVTDDQPLFWVWINAANTTTVVFDVRVICSQGGGIVADLNALQANPGLDGQRLRVDSLNVDFVFDDTGWVQDGFSKVATTTARDTEYAKAGGAYLVAGTQSLVAADGGMYVRDSASWSRVWAPGQGPYAMAAGIAAPVSTTADTVVTLPAGRFNVAPIVTLGPSYVAATGALGGGAVLAYPSPNTTDFRIRAVSVTGVSVQWTAVQMTPTSAAG